MSSVRSETSKPESTVGVRGSGLVVQGYQTVAESMEEDFWELSMHISFSEILEKHHPVCSSYLPISKCLQDQVCLQHNLPKAPQLF